MLGRRLCGCERIDCTSQRGEYADKRVATLVPVTSNLDVADAVQRLQRPNSRLQAPRSPPVAEDLRERYSVGADRSIALLGVGDAPTKERGERVSVGARDCTALVSAGDAVGPQFSLK